MTQSQTSMTSPIGDFFTVRDRFPVNLIALESADSIPDEDAFIAEIPELFTIASSMAESDQQQLQSIKVEQSSGSALDAFLEQQHKRMNILLGYMLRNEDDPAHRFEGVEYGGGGIRIINESPLTEGQTFQAKLFFKEVQDPERYGVGTFTKQNKLTKIEEKPKKPKSNLGCMGIYMYSNKVFNALKKIKKSPL